MSPPRSISRRRFLQSSLALAGASALPLHAAAPDLKLKKPIRIGCQCILSGPLGGHGEFMRKGATLGMEEINAGGCIGGSPAELKFPDAALPADLRLKKAAHFCQA